MSLEIWQWILLVCFSSSLLIAAPRARAASVFFRANNHKGEAPGPWLVTSSLVIGWIMAKSITNAANLGLKFGLLGGFTYALYYLSFLIAGLVIYDLRTRGHFASIHEFLRSKFGRTSVQLFSLLIAFRLFNEVWSNTMIIGQYFGAPGSGSYYLSIAVFTGLTLLYSLKGGLRSSLITDSIQFLLFGLLLFTILGFLLQDQGTVDRIVHPVVQRDSSGWNLLFVVLIQILSYPFHDPVLTDRGFISTPKHTLVSYSWAAVVGFLCILLFSVVGIYAQSQGLVGDATREVGKSLGFGLTLIFNLIMLTSAGSTLDSTFSSFSKLIVFDLGWIKNRGIKQGQLAMIGATLLGTVPIFLNPAILDATTISGTMVLGLAPIFLLWRMKVKRSAFLATVGTGLFFGLAHTFKWFPAEWILFDGEYGDLLTFNLISTVTCFLVYFAHLDTENESTVNSVTEP
ncbi:MAG TPA: sodium:solute symporter [Luteibaculaceae bacterium]|nr:sodium:solute symporter [Luteibaculaceae bacterium]